MASGLHLLRKYDGILIIIMLASDLLQKSAIPQAIFDKSYLILFGTVFAIIGYFLLVEALRGNVFPTLFAAAFVLFLVWQCYSYQAIARQPANINAIAPYVSFLAFIPLVVQSRSSEYPLRALFYLTLVYSAIYVLFNSYFLNMFSSGDQSIILRDSVRESRLILANSMISFLLFFSLCNLRKRVIFGVIGIAFSGSALYLAQSRFFTFVVIFVLLIAVISYLAPVLRRLIGYGCALAFTTICIYSIMGFFGSANNPYEQLFTDQSGAARYLEYRAAVSHFSDSRLFLGMGIAPSIELLQQFVKSLAPFYPSDLGASGIFFNFGLFGFLAFIALSITMMIAVPKRWNRSPERLGLYYAGLASAAIGFFAAHVAGASGTMIAALVLATVIRENRSTVIGRLFTASLRQRQTTAMVPVAA